MIYVQPAASPAPANADDGDFDRDSARLVLRSIPYKDCGPGHDGKLYVTFSADGKVVEALLVAGAYDKATASCIEARFANAHVPPFASAKIKTVGWTLAAVDPKPSEF